MRDPIRSVLVTGASSGIGWAIASLLAQEGYRVFVGVRSAEKFAELTAAKNDLLIPVQLEVTCPEQTAAAMRRIAEVAPEGLYALVNNAGVGSPAAVELSDLEDVRNVLEVNTVGPLRMIQACLPLLRQGGGRVINMSSMNGTFALPMVGAYSASKFALEALSDSLRVELRPWGIPVTVIRPGQVRTSIFIKARALLDQRTREIPADLVGGYRLLYERAGSFNDRGANALTRPEAVARVVLRVLEARRPRSRYLVGLDVRGMQLAQLFFPQRLLDRILARASGASAHSPGNE